MSEMNHPDPSPSEQQSRRFARILATMYLPVVLIFVYVSSLTAFFRWEEKSTNSAEFVRRVNIRNRIYSPLIWLKAHDPSESSESRNLEGQREMSGSPNHWPALDAASPISLHFGVHRRGASEAER